jgi:hypothetical protein
MIRLWFGRKITIGQQGGGALDLKNEQTGAVGA